MILDISDRLAADLDALPLGEAVAYVYNPLVYARQPWARYLERYGAGQGRAILLGMNPGPWGMAQTGVPFGDVTLVRDWLGITGEVAHPPREHPKRPVTGFACTRGEGSGQRLWGWARERFGTPESFFADFFVANYCPLLLLDAQGKNLTPDKLPAREAALLARRCDQALRECVAALRPKMVVGVGAYAEGRAREALAATGVAVGRVLHPSPASPAANRGWRQAAEAQLAALGLLEG
jgi:single-strand selective monofunctional uracil DNA glycosylase